MSTINNGGPAFPAGSIRKSRSAADPGADFVVTAVVAPKYAGMTLRDYFAGCELKKIEGTHINDEPGAYDNLAKHCYRMADAMLAAREGKSGGGAA